MKYLPTQSVGSKITRVFLINVKECRVRKSTARFSSCGRRRMDNLSSILNRPNRRWTTSCPSYGLRNADSASRRDCELTFILCRGPKDHASWFESVFNIVPTQSRSSVYGRAWQWSAGSLLSTNIKRPLRGRFWSCLGRHRRSFPSVCHFQKESGWVFLWRRTWPVLDCFCRH